MKRLTLFLLLAIGQLVAPLAAHDLSLTRTVVRLNVAPEAGTGVAPVMTWEADVLCDLDALSLGAPTGADSAEIVATLHSLSTADLDQLHERLLAQLSRRVRVRFDDLAAQPEISLPDLTEDFRVRLSAGGQPTIFGLRARFSGTIPEGAQEFTFRASRAFPPVHLTIDDRRFDPPTQSFELLQRGVPSSAYPLDAEPVAEPIGETVSRYVALGFIHILPAGLDHILFVLGLFLLSAAWRPLLWQVSAFTAAHTITLGLATVDWIRLSPHIVEPLIAASICWIAVENLFTDELKNRRIGVVFAFGLLHGLGFAGVLGELGLPEGRRLIALLSFNVGVELGQLAVLALAFLALGLCLQRPWYRKRLAQPLSLGIALIGLFWVLERIGISG